MNNPALANCLADFRERVTARQGERELLDFDGPVVGTYCNFVPDELIWALGGRTIRLCSGQAPEQSPGAEFLACDVCPVVKSAAALPLADARLWDRLDLLVVPASCDAKKKLADMFRRRKAVHIMDVPAFKDANSARDYWFGEVERLVECLQKVFRRKITRIALEQAVRLSMRREALFRTLLELRPGDGANGALLSGEQFQFVAGASFADEPVRYTERLAALVAALQAAQRDGYQAIAAAAPRVMLAGAPLIYPNYKLLQIIHEAGAVVVADDSCAATHRLCQHLVPRDWSHRELLKALAEKTLLACLCPCFASSTDRIVRIRELVPAVRASGVIYHQLRNCALFSIESEILRRELLSDGVPLLIVNTDSSLGDTEYLRNRIDAFMEILTARKQRAARVPAVERQEANDDLRRH